MLATRTTSSAATVPPSIPAVLSELSAAPAPAPAPSAVLTAAILTIRSAIGTAVWSSIGSIGSIRSPIRSSVMLHRLHRLRRLELHRRRRGLGDASGRRCLDWRGGFGGASARLGAPGVGRRQSARVGSILRSR